MVDPREQGHVLRGIAAAWVVIVVWFGLAWLVFAPRVTPDTLADRLHLALAWDLAVVATLVVAVGLIARHRFFFNRMDGGWDEGDTRLQIYRYNLANTAEQVLIAVPVHLAFAVVAPAGALWVLPAAALLFCGGRVAFLAGYLSGRPTNRAVGFGCTYYPSVILLVIAAALAVWPA